MSPYFTGNVAALAWKLTHLFRLYGHGAHRLALGYFYSYIIRHAVRVLLGIPYRLSAAPRVLTGRGRPRIPGHRIGVYSRTFSRACADKVVLEGNESPQRQYHT